MRSIGSEMGVALGKEGYEPQWYGDRGGNVGQEGFFVSRALTFLGRYGR